MVPWYCFPLRSHLWSPPTVYWKTHGILFWSVSAFMGPGHYKKHEVTVELEVVTFLFAHQKENWEHPTPAERKMDWKIFYSYPFVLSFCLFSTLSLLMFFIIVFLDQQTKLNIDQKTWFFTIFLLTLVELEVIVVKKTILAEQITWFMKVWLVDCRNVVWVLACIMSLELYWLNQNPWEREHNGPFLSVAFTSLCCHSAV